MSAAHSVFGSVGSFVWPRFRSRTREINTPSQANRDGFGSSSFLKKLRRFLNSSLIQVIANMVVVPMLLLPISKYSYNHDLVCSPNGLASEPIHPSKWICTEDSQLAVRVLRSQSPMKHPAPHIQIIISHFKAKNRTQKVSSSYVELVEYLIFRKTLTCLCNTKTFRESPRQQTHLYKLLQKHR